MEMHFDKFKLIYKQKVDDSLKCLCSKKYHLKSVFVKNNYLIPSNKYLLGSHCVSLLCTIQIPNEKFTADEEFIGTRGR